MERLEEKAIHTSNSSNTSISSENEGANGKAKYFLSAFGAAAWWGFMSIPLKAIASWSAEEILYYRILVSLLVVWAVIFIFRKKQLRADIAHVKSLPPGQRFRLFFLAFLAAVFIFGNWYTFIYAVNHISVQSAAFAYMVCPLLTTLAAFLILKEQLSRIKFFALGVALISVLMLSQGSIIEVIWSVSMALLYALYLIVQRVMRGVDKLNVLAMQITICAIAVVPMLVFGDFTLPTSALFWNNVVIIAVLFTVLPLYMSMYALNGISSSTVGILIYINPIISFAVAIFYFGESVDNYKIMAYCVLLLAVFLFNWEFIRGLSSKAKVTNFS